MILPGVIMLVTPLALWAAWSITVFLAVLMLGLCAAAGYRALYRTTHAPSQASDNRESPGESVFPRQIDEEAIKVLHGGWPWYCHHTTDGTSRFRKTMNKFADLTGTARRY